MKTGKNLVELAQELTRIKTNSKDFVVPVSKMSMNTEGALDFGGQAYTPNNYSHQQIASFTEIPKSYYDTLKEENKILLARNVNHGFSKFSGSDKNGKSESRMVRTLDGNVRAFLGSRYRRLDCYDLLETVAPLLIDGGLTVESSEITEKKMYIKAVSSKMTGEIQKGDAVQYGLVISSSDVGAGSVRVEPLVYRLVCQNGLIMPTAMRKYHSGRNQNEDDIFEVLSDKTKELSDVAFWAQVRDIVKHSLDPKNFETELDRLRLTAGMKITNPDIHDVVELTMKSVGVSGEEKKEGIVAALARGCNGAGLNKWGMINAFTEHAQTLESYDESTDLERAAGKIITLDPRQWRRIAELAV